MLKNFIQKVLQNIRSSSLAKNKGQLVRTIVTTVIVLAVIIVIFIFRSSISPKLPSNEASPDSTNPDNSEAVDVIATSLPTVVITPSPTPTPEPPAITPPADEPDPASGTDIIFESEPPATDTDIN